MRQVIILTVLIFLLLVVSCEDKNACEINVLFESLVDNVAAENHLIEFKELPLEKAIHRGNPEIFVHSFDAALTDERFKKCMISYYAENNLDTLNWHDFYVFKVHFHHYLNKREVDMEKLKDFVSENAYPDQSSYE